MRLVSLQHMGSFGFPKVPISIDYTALPTVVCVAGGTGAGKTTFLDLPWAALYLKMPFRISGPLHRRFAQKGYIRLHWEAAGHRYYSDVRVDPKSEKVEASLYEEPEGEKRIHLAGPLSADYKRAVERLIGSLDVALASTYTVQPNPNREHDSGSFLSLSKAERRDLFAELLALDRYEEMHAVASARSKERDLALQAVRGQRDALKPLSEAVPAAQAALQESEHARQDLLAKIPALEQACADADLIVREVDEKILALDQLVKQREQVYGEIQKLRLERDDIQQRISNNQTLLSRQAEVLADHQEYERLTAKIESVSTGPALHVAELRAELAALEIDLNSARAETEKARELYRTARSSRQVKELALNAERTRLQQLREQFGILDEVPCHGAGVYASCPLLSLAKNAAEMSVSVKESIEELTLDLEEPLPPEPLDTAQALSIQHATLTMQIADITSAVSAETNVLVAKREKYAKNYALKPSLDVAQARIEELATRLDALTGEIGAREKTLAQCDVRGRDALVLVKDAAVNTAKAHRASLAEHQRVIAARERHHGTLQEKLKSATQAKERLEAIEAEMAPLLQDLADWALIGKFCSPTGAPALRVDEALPEISREATAMLRECYDGDHVFAIRLSSQRESKDSKKLIEDLRIEVFLNGKEVDLAALSGGQLVLVSEAISLGIGRFRARNTGRRYELLMRDESSSALDPVRARGYINLLRRAAVSDSIRNVLFVSHQEAVQKMADGVIWVKDGAIDVQVA